MARSAAASIFFSPDIIAYSMYRVGGANVTIQATASTPPDYWKLILFQ